ncbi:MAG: hypothetical protein JO316_14725 [Abitibacteriaceae bacterium]|nr:hypothetical protein [Abditibacteriaceae bacterium]
MKQRYWYLGLAALGCFLVTVKDVGAQPDPNDVGKAANPPARQNKQAKKLRAANKGNTLLLGPKLAEREIQQLEEMFGQHLTEKQKQAIATSATTRNDTIIAAQKKHQENVAAALGITVEDLALKRKAYLQLHKGVQLNDEAAIRKGLRRGNLQ